MGFPLNFAVLQSAELGQLAQFGSRHLQAGLQWVIPVVLLAAGLVVGLVLERFLLAQARKIAARTHWEGDEISLGAFRGMLLLWCVLGGAYAALESVELRPRLETIAHESLLIVFLLTLTLVAARIASGVVGLYSQKSEGLFPSTSIFRNLTAVAVFLCGVLVVLETLGISITPILTALGVGGLAVALALQDTLSNLFAGIQIIASRQVRLGDYIKLSSGEEGYVTDIRWRNTTLRALANNVILIPNAKLASSITTNYNMPEKEMGIGVPVTVAYGSDLQKVERVTLEVAAAVMREVAGGVPQAQPSIGINKFGDSGIQFSVNLRAREFVDQYLLTHELLKRLHDRYQQEGIVVPYPARTVYLNDGSRLQDGDRSSPSGVAVRGDGQQEG